MLQKIFPEYKINPRIFFMSDGSLAIRNAASSVLNFETPSSIPLILMFCTFHFWKAVEVKAKNKDYIPKIDSKIDIPHRFKQQFSSCQSNKQGQNQVARIIKFDIRILQYLPTQIMYLNYLKIIRPFWKNYAPKFLEYFISTYVDMRKNDCL